MQLNVWSNIKHNGLSHSSFEVMLSNFQNSKGMYANSFNQLVENVINRKKLNRIYWLSEWLYFDELSD